MKELTLIKNEVTKTPIETALEIDEQGYTTAKKLYAWLELEDAHYARWIRTNLLENPFAEEGTDFSPLRVKSRKGVMGRPSNDYKLSATFAKELAMTAKTERGEQARIYFVMCEQMLAKLAKEHEKLVLERAKGIAVRKSLTDVIIESGENDRMKGHAFSTYTDLVYKEALGKTARKLREERGLDKNDNLRDYLTEEEVEAVMKVEAAVADLIGIGWIYPEIKEAMDGKKEALPA